MDAKSPEPAEQVNSPQDYGFTHGEEGALSSLFKGKDLSNLDARRSYSASVLQRVEERLHRAIDYSQLIESVAVAGSYGRLEASELSDFDFFVIAQNNAINKRADERELVNIAWKSIESLRLVPPDDNGIFTRVLSSDQLCDKKALGDLDYPRHVFGLRIQILTDSQPIFMPDNFVALQQRIIRWYCQPGYSPFSRSPLQYFISDLRRYFHSYSIWHQYRLDKTFNDSWLMRQIKMDHSRLTSYVSLLMCLLHHAQQVDTGELEWDEHLIANQITSDLKQTPVQRLAKYWPVKCGNELDEFLVTYDRVAGVISDQYARQNIIDSDPTAVMDKRALKDTGLSQAGLNQLVIATGRIRQTLASCLQQTALDSTPSVAAMCVL